MASVIKNNNFINPLRTLNCVQMLRWLPIYLYLINITSAVVMDMNKSKQYHRKIMRLRREISGGSRNSVVMDTNERIVIDGDQRLKRKVVIYDGDKKVDVKHGGVPMGISNGGCDNAQFNLHIDWDNSTDYEYKCQSLEHPIPMLENVFSLEECLPKEDVPAPIHTCMNTVIEYKDKPPRGGPHRPLWPVYGEYVYCPPQRWVHSLEHGAVVFLYHPCADADQIEALKKQARTCIRKHVISPYRGLTEDRPFAVVTWGCRLLMNTMDIAVIHTFIKEHALDTEERKVTRDGLFSWGLLRQAELVSDIDDSILCPNDNMVAENMEKPYVSKQSYFQGDQRQ